MNKILLLVKNLELDVRCGGLEVVIDDGAFGRIFRSGLFRRQGRAEEAIVVHSDGSGWPKKPCAFSFRDVMHLPQRRDVIENPERTPVGGNHEIISVNDQAV